MKSCLENCLRTALAGRVFGEQDKSNMPNAPFRKYQTSGFAFEAYSFAIHNAEKGVLTTLNNTQLNLNLKNPESISILSRLHRP